MREVRQYSMLRCKVPPCTTSKPLGKEVTVLNVSKRHLADKREENTCSR